jgi:hypothetical protein
MVAARIDRPDASRVQTFTVKGLPGFSVTVPFLNYGQVPYQGIYITHETAGTVSSFVRNTG